MSNQLNQRTINLSQKTRPTTVAQDTSYTVKPYDKYIVLDSLAATTKVLTLPAMDSVQVINIRMNSRVAGEYTAIVTGGVLTFNATGESAQIISNPITGLGWQVISLNGATIV
jgi:hypothetical protein